MSNEMIIERAKSAEMSHDFSTAARLYKELLQQDDTNVEYLQALGSIYVNAGDDKKAIPYFEQIHSLHPENVDAMNSLGAIYRRLKRYDDSTQILTKALESGQNQISTYYNLGFTLKEMKNYDDAVDAFENVIAINPRDVLTHNHLGSIYLETNELDKAVAAYKRGLQIDPNHPILNYNLARTYTRLKNYPDAIRCYESALKTRPNWPEAIQKFSALLVQCQRSEEAAHIVRQSIKIHPNDPELLYTLGQVYLNQFDYDNAKKTFRQANAVKSNDVKILTALASAYEKADDSDKALDTILSAIELEPLNTDARMQYVDTLLSVSDYDSAFENLESLNSDTGEKNVQVMDLYGQYYITQGDDEKAESYFERIKKTDHHYKDYMLGASKRYAQVEKYENAEKYAKDFVKSRASRPEGYNMLGKIYTKGGRYTEAKAAYEQSAKVRKSNVLARQGVENIIRLQREPVPGLSAVEDFPQAGELPAAEQFSAPPKAENQFSLSDEIKADDILDEDFDAPSFGDDEGFAAGNDDKTLSAEKTEATDEDFDIFDEMDEEEAGADSLQAEQLLDAIGDAENEEAAKFLRPEGNDDLEGLEPLPELGPEPAFADASFQPAQEIPAEGQASLAAQNNNPANAEESGAGLAERMDALSQATKTAQDALKIAMDAESRVKEMEEKQKQFEEALEEAAAESPEADKIDEPETLEGAESVQAEAAEEENPKENGEETSDYEEIPDDVVEDADDSEFALAPSDDSNFDGEFAAELNDDLDTTPFTNVIELYAELLATYGDLDDTDAAEQLADLSQQIESGEVVVSESKDKGSSQGEFIAPAESPATGNENVKELEDVAEMLRKIEAILSDDKLALQYTREISLLKRLKVMCEYLPKDEKISFASGRTRMLIDYLLAKMSGKPGLLLTAKSLLKSGVLGNEYRVQLISECEDELNNELIRRVLVYMKKLSQSLEDFGLSAALQACADGALEKIEMKNQKSQIF